MADLFKDTKLLTKSYFECALADNPITLEDAEPGTVAGAAALSGKVVCLFFSASWCTPCQHFVPMLKEIYTELQRRGEALEVVFVTFDKTEEEMLNYYQHKHGDWLALKFRDPLRDVLAEKYSISVVPKLVVIQPSGDVITSKGRKDIQDKGLVCMRAWQAGMVVKADKHETGEAVDGQQITETSGS